LFPRSGSGAPAGSPGFPFPPGNSKRFIIPGRSRIARGIGLFLLFFLTGCGGYDPDEEPYIIITSDIHVSSDEGRMQQGNGLFVDFIEKVKNSEYKPEKIFIIGDIVDNAISVGKTVIAGSPEHWRKDVEKYLILRNELPSIPFVHALGAGHDYGAKNVTRDMAVAVFGPERGFVDWREIRFIWFDVRRASFGMETEHVRDVLTVDELSWLAAAIQAAPNNVILLSHVPVRTPETLEAGVWFNKTNLTIPADDSLYRLLEEQQGKIAAIFNGHIHQALSARLGSIPVYLCPLVPDGTYCTVALAKDGTMKIAHRSIEEE